jgi:hypothetical protein
MRHRRVLILVAALTALAASAIAAAAPPVTGVTISAKQRIIVYGAHVGLFGTVVPAQQNGKVTVLAAECATGAVALAKATPTKITATTTNTGSWSATVTPTVTTGYAARVKNVTSTVAASVAVRPAVALTKLRAHRFQARITAAQSFAGKQAVFQRLRPARGTWTTLRRVTLGQLSVTTTAPTVMSGATFRSGVRQGRRVRLVLPQSQAGSCYMPGRSATIRS